MTSPHTGAWASRPRVAEIPSNQRVEGFTLIELLVAMTITSLLVAVLAATLQAVSGATQYTEGRVEAEREARATFEMLERDLASALRREGGWISVINDPDPPTTGEQPLWLIFLATPLDHDRDAAGDICVVSYRTGHGPLPGEDEPFPSLHRLVISADEAFENVLDQATLSEDVFAKIPTAGEESRALKSWLAAGVVGMEIRGWTARTSFDLASPGRADSTDQLEALEVTLEVLTKQGQLLYGKLTPSELRKRHTHRFTRKIPIPLPSP